MAVLDDIRTHLAKSDATSRPLLERAQDEDEVQNWRRDGSVIERVEKCRYCGGEGVEIIEVEPIDLYDLDELAPPAE